MCSCRPLLGPRYGCRLYRTTTSPFSLLIQRYTTLMRIREKKCFRMKTIRCSSMVSKICKVLLQFLIKLLRFDRFLLHFFKSCSQKIEYSRNSRSTVRGINLSRPNRFDEIIKTRMLNQSENLCLRDGSVILNFAKDVLRSWSGHRSKKCTGK